jgi:hypothetical protein
MNNTTSVSELYSRCRSEMGKVQKAWHSLKQTFFFFLLPVVFLGVTVCPCLEQAPLLQTIIRQSHVPVNRPVNPFSLRIIKCSMPRIFCRVLSDAWHRLCHFCDVRKKPSYFVCSIKFYSSSKNKI